MNIQADISWIQSELVNVKDPYLIEAFKNMLKYRKTKASDLLSLPTQDDLVQRAEESMQSIEKGETITLDRFKADNKEWLTNRFTK